MIQAAWEKALLGSILAEPACMQAAEDLRPSDFTGGNQVLWAEMLALHRREALDLRTLIETLRGAEQLDQVGDDLDGETYLRDLLSYRGGDVEEYAEQVIDASLKRQLRQVAALIRAEAEDERLSADDAMDAAEERLIRLRRGRRADEAVPLGDILAAFGTRFDGFLNGTIQPAWVPEIDAIKDVLGFIDEEDFVIVAARPGEGKSSLLRFELGMAALRGEPCLIFNMENGETEYAKFMIAMVTGIDSDLLKNPGRLAPQQIDQVREAAQVLAGKPLFVKTIGSPSVSDVVRISRQHVLRHRVKRIGVDYIQLIRNATENRVQDLTETSGRLRGLALDTKVPVAAACQMSRSIVHRGAEAEPQLSDLRESGSLEQDATQVWFPRWLWPEPSEGQLRLYADNLNPQGQLYPGIKAIPIKVFIRKNRNGPTGVTQPILWRRHVNQFGTLQEV
jgi:replicative DNA helicase